MLKSACELLGCNSITESLESGSPLLLSNVRHTISQLFHVAQFATDSTTPDHSLIHSSMSILYHFLSKDMNATKQLDAERLQAISETFSPSFLAALFHYRYLTNAAATTQIEEEESYCGLMSCVDILLDSLCDAILSFSNNSFEENNLQNSQELAFCIFTSSHMHKEKLLSIIARLPVTWNETIATLNSNHVAAASKRVVLILLYGAYVLSPQITGLSNLKALPHDVRKILGSHIPDLVEAQIVADEAKEDGPYMDYMRNSQYTLTLILLSLDVNGFDDGPTSSTHFMFKPVTRTIMIDMLSVVMGFFTATGERQSLAMASLNTNQRRLLTWGLFVPWTWRVFEETAPSDMVILLTETWLYHCTDDVRMKYILHFMPVYALKILLIILQKPVTKSNHMVFLIRLRSIWGVCLICTEYEKFVSHDLLHKTIEILLVVISEISWEHDDVSFAVYEAIIKFLLSLSKNHALSSRNYSLEVLNRVKHAFVYVPTILPTLLEEQNSDIQTLTSLENLIVFCWLELFQMSDLSNTNVLYQQTTKLICSRHRDVSVRRCAITLLLCLLDTRITSGSDLISLEFISEAIIPHIPRDDIGIASGISCVIHKQFNCGRHSLLTVQLLWDYLRDALLLLLIQHPSLVKMPADNLLKDAFDTICSAIGLIVSVIPQNYVRTFLDSPWTFTLCNQLKISGSSQASLSLVQQIEQLVEGGLASQIELKKTHIIVPYHYDASPWFHFLCLMQS